MTDHVCHSEAIDPHTRLILCCTRDYAHGDPHERQDDDDIRHSWDDDEAGGEATCRHREGRRESVFDGADAAREIEFDRWPL